MNKNGLEFTDFLNLFSLYLNIRNLTENEQQSDQQIKILSRIDINAANDKQAAYLLAELGRKFDEQNAMLRSIMEVLHSEKH